MIKSQTPLSVSIFTGKLTMNEQDLIRRCLTTLNCELILNSQVLMWGEPPAAVSVALVSFF